MSCSKCNQYISTCNNCNPCEEVDDSCSCVQKDMSTDCSLFTGDTLACSGIPTNTSLTKVIEDLDAHVCNLFTQTSQLFNLSNVGNGAEIYRGNDNLGQRELRTLISSSSVTVQQNTDDISFEVDPTFISDSETLTIISNPQDAELVYQDEDGNTTTIDLGPIIETYLQANPTIICDLITACAGNLPPTVNAGSDQGITLPIDTSSATATASDPDGIITAISWVQISGPNTATILNGTTLTPTFNGLIEGTYIFEITVTDDGVPGLQATDTMQVVVSPAVVNQPPSAVGDNTITASNRATTELTLAMFTTDTTPVYTDPEGDPVDALRVDSLPADGTLLYNSIAVVVNQIISAADITAGLFEFTSPNQDTINTTSFSFSLRDTGSLTFVSS